MKTPIKSTIRRRFKIWRRAPFKRALGRAYSEGLINSAQLHELSAKFDCL
ncbi:MAG: hypothetical protein ABIS50_11385 [Luteolibacter sp.]